MNPRHITKLSTHPVAFFLPLATIALAVVMQCVQEYRFYAKEAEHLWLNDPSWLMEWLGVPGGVVQLATSALTQWFGVWGVGAGVMALVLGCVMYGGLGLQQRLRLPAWLTAWWLLPAVLLMLCHENGYYALRGTLATALAMLVARVYAARPKAWLSVGLVAAVYALAGAAGMLLAVLIGVIEALSERGWLRMALALLTAVLCAGMGVRYGVWTSMEEALTPAQYYEWPSTYFIPLYAWTALALVPVLGRILAEPQDKVGESQQEQEKAKLGWRQRTMWVLSVVVPVAVGCWLYPALHNPKIYLLREDEWRASRQDWDGIIRAHEGLEAVTPFMSYLNLALAERGQLVERMGEFHPYIVWSDEAQRYSPVLMTQNELSRDALKLQSAVCWAWGGAALCNAQKAAFEANFLTPGMTDPVELHRLVLTNLLFDTPEVARKYLRRLQRTTRHDAWADSLLCDSLRFAHATAQMAPLPAEDAFYLKTQVSRLLRQITLEQPDNRVAAQFYEAYLIQSRDSVGWVRFRAER